MKKSSRSKLVNKGRKSKAPVAILSADWHLSPYIWSNRRYLHGDSYHALDRLVELCLHYDVPLIGAGDLFNTTSPDSESVLFLYHQIERMASKELPVYYVQGQHERAAPAWLNIHPWAVHVHKTAFEIAGLVCFGLDNVSSNKWEDALSSVPVNTDLLVAHQTLQEFMGGVARSCSLGAMVKSPLLLTGDFHANRALNTKNVDGRPLTIISPGATHRRRTSDSEPFGCYLLLNDLSLEFLELPGRPFLRFPKIQSTEMLDDFRRTAPGKIKSARKKAIVQGCPVDIAEPLVYVEYELAVDPNIYRKITDIVDPKFLFDCAYIETIGTEEELPDELPEKLWEIGARSCLSEIVDSEEEPELFSLVDHLLEAEGKDVDVLLEELYSELIL